MEQHTYLVIDLKSFYASVECAERGLDPMTARLVVADPERTESITGAVYLRSRRVWTISWRSRG